MRGLGFLGLPRSGLGGAAATIMAMVGLISQPSPAIVRRIERPARAGLRKRSQSWSQAPPAKPFGPTGHKRTRRRHRN